MAAKPESALQRRLRVLAMLLALPALLAASGQPADPLSEREAAQARLDELNLQLAAGAEELGRLGGELRSLELESARARAVEEGARRRVEVAQQRVTDAQARLAEIEGMLAEHSQALSERAAQLYISGAIREADVLAGLGMEDSKQLTVRMPYLEALALSDAALVEDTEAVRAVAEAVRDRLDELRAGAQEQENLAREAALTVEGLGSQQQQIAAAAQAEQDRRDDLLAALQQDAAAREVLVQRLEALASGLSAELATAPGEANSTWIERLPPAGQGWGQSIIRAAGAAGIDPRLLAALAWTESNFRPRVVSPAGAIGLTQLMPSTAAEVGVDPYDPDDNLVGGARYLARLLDRYLNRAELALAAYNAGPGEVDDAGGVPDIPETQLYVTRVLGHYETLTG